jgi:hypothetical protein
VGSGAGAASASQAASSGNSLRDKLLSTAAASLAAHALGSNTGTASTSVPTSMSSNPAATAVFDPAFSVDGTEELSAGAPLGTFVHLPHVCKLFETLKGAYKVPGRVAVQFFLRHWRVSLLIVGVFLIRRASFRWMPKPPTDFPT